MKGRRFGKIGASYWANEHLRSGCSRMFSFAIHCRHLTTKTTFDFALQELESQLHGHPIGGERVGRTRIAIYGLIRLTVAISAFLRADIRV